MLISEFAKSTSITPCNKKVSVRDRGLRIFFGEKAFGLLQAGTQQVKVKIMDYIMGNYCKFLNPSVPVNCGKKLIFNGSPLNTRKFLLPNGPGRLASGGATHSAIFGWKSNQTENREFISMQGKSYCSHPESFHSWTMDD